MIRIILSIALVIVIIVFIWRYFLFSEKKVRFEEKVDKIIIPNREEIKEDIKEDIK
jgi:hypothetical protein